MVTGTWRLIDHTDHELICETIITLARKFQFQGKELDGPKVT